ncbi:hypothetical protein PGT21_021876 [Puccinia graminis f. sp. tritici]|uniref:Uncharacterized protein n=1 Tax=Puccinia graminis f. sp. tritici TaxID=56615 RepID=A0A5B0MCC3_PUCGR|nr:hypothetical protein PGT21_021876 [Puccinia graminis f. sp. tritici]
MSFTPLLTDVHIGPLALCPKAMTAQAAKSKAIDDSDSDEEEETEDDSEDSVPDALTPQVPKLNVGNLARLLFKKLLNR